MQDAGCKANANCPQITQIDANTAAHPRKETQRREGAKTQSRKGIIVDLINVPRVDGGFAGNQESPATREKYG